MKTKRKVQVVAVLLAIGATWLTFATVDFLAQSGADQRSLLAAAGGPVVR
jgi:hypothetical protein